MNEYVTLSRNVNTQITLGLRAFALGSKY